MIEAQTTRSGTTFATHTPAQDGVGDVNADQLRAYIERVERLQEEKKALGDDIAEVYAEAKGNGYDVKVLREIVKIRGQDREKRTEFETVLDLYLAALGAAGCGL